jgi:hypothetical protein
MESPAQSLSDEGQQSGDEWDGRFGRVGSCGFGRRVGAGFAGFVWQIDFCMGIRAWREGFSNSWRRVQRLSRFGDPPERYGATGFGCWSGVGGRGRIRGGSAGLKTLQAGEGGSELAIVAGFVAIEQFERARAIGEGAEGHEGLRGKVFAFDAVHLTRKFGWWISWSSPAVSMPQRRS